MHTGTECLEVESVRSVWLYFKFHRLAIGLALSALLCGPTAIEAQILSCAREIVETESERCGRETRKGAGSAAAFASCIQRSEATVAKQLGRAYRDRIARSSRLMRDALRETQRVWRRFQNVNCNYEEMIGELEGPSFGRAFRASCLLLNTAIRICQIEAFDEYF
ncbi:MAG: lysozyme inhibitor LprI family protein [Hyphomicrobiaceae bacterium]